MRVATYLRVSTKRQAEKDLSIPDQRKQLEAHCRKLGWTVVREYVEAGASATSDNRPEFQNMVSASREKPCPFDIVLVHSFSRFSRDAFQLEFYVRELKKRGARVVSLTQDTTDDPMGQMVRQIFGVFDEYQSKENAKHTLRAMKENARQGFWNGAPPPYGYRIVDAEKRGERVKKKLDPDPKEAELVRRMFQLYLNGDGSTGPLGVKGIAVHLNAKGFRQRQGRRFSNAFVQHALRETAYAGTYYFNRVDSRTKQRKPENERVASVCPSIVDPQMFEAVQRRLNERHPGRTPGRRLNNPILLSGIVKCERCGSTMSLRTGKGGKYRYYSCLKQTKQGSAGCKGTSVPMSVLDSAVTEALLEKVLSPARMLTLIRALSAKKRTSEKATSQDMAALVRRLREAEARLDRLYDALERGTVAQDDYFRSRVNAAKADRDEVLKLKAQLERRVGLTHGVISPKKLEAFCAGMSDMLRNGDIQFRKAYLRLFVSEIIVGDDTAYMSGSKEALIAAASEELPGKSGVPTFVQEWRPQQDSNLRSSARKSEHHADMLNVRFHETRSFGHEAHGGVEALHRYLGVEHGFGEARVFGLREHGFHQFPSGLAAPVHREHCYPFDLGHALVGA